MSVPVCIAGMHRSGTSMVAGLLQICGVYLGEESDLVPASMANPAGYFENGRFVELNEELLAALGGDWDTPVEIPPPSSPRWIDDETLATLKRRAQADVRALGGHGVWGWKDPRNTILLPFWRSILPDLRIIVCVRHPLEVAASLNRVDPNASIADGVRRWMAYNERIVAESPTDARLVTHAAAYFGRSDEQVSELQRLLDFVGLEVSDETRQTAIATIRRDLRRNRMTADDVVGFELPADVLARYASLCDEAGWHAARARTEAPGPPVGAVLVEEFERLAGARRLDARRVAAAEATVARLDSELYYLRTVRNVRRVAEELVPADEGLLVVSHGDDDLLVGPRAGHFPQGGDGRYAGFYPSSSLNAIGHLEALRAKGPRFLLVPRSERWWLDHYREFDEYLRQRYHLVLEDRHSCALFALDESGDAATSWDRIREAIAACEELIGREPALLDCESGLDLAIRLPDRTIFTPPGHTKPLPYLDGSIDIVVVAEGASADRIAEAERIAACAVIMVSDGVRSGDSDPIVRWKIDRERGRRQVSLLVPAVHSDPAPLLRSLSETLPRSFLGEIVIAVDTSRRAASIIDGWRAASAVRLIEVPSGTSLGTVYNTLADDAVGALVVFLDPRAVLLPGWLPALTHAFRDRDGLTAAGGRVLLPDGRLLHAGGTVSASGEIADIVEGAGAAEQLGRATARRVQWCSSALLATRRDTFLRCGGFDATFASARAFAADYCLKVAREGGAVLCEPDAITVLLDDPAEGHSAPRLVQTLSGRVDASAEEARA